MPLRSRRVSGTMHRPRTHPVGAVGVVLATVVLIGLSSCSPSDPQRAAPSAATPAELGAKIDRYISNIYSPAASRVRAVVVTVDGRVRAAVYRHGSPTQTYDVHSITKSVIGTLVGLALDEGRLRSLDDTLANMLPDRAAQMSTTVGRITLRQLLTMTSGLPADPPNGADLPFMASRDWVGTILRTGVTSEPGSGFAYSSAGSHLLAAVLTHATGMSVLDYARPRLFDPLGIDTRNAAEPHFSDADIDTKYDQAEFAWPKDPTGIQTGFAALKLKPTDMEKLGRLYLQQGRWNGREVVPRSWIQLATTAHSAPPGAPGTGAESYGYQWWVTQELGHPAYLAAGFGGQLIEVVPDVHLVVAVATQADPNTNLKWDQLRGLIRDIVLPAATR